MRLLLDEMISDQVAERLNDRGADVIAATAEEQMRGQEDPDLFAVAQDLERAFVTYNIGDFQGIVRDWAEAGRTHHGIVFIGNASIPQGDLGRLTDAVDRLLATFQPWSSFTHWLSDEG